MLVNHPNITQKNYRKLSICLRPEGFSFCVTDTLSGNVLLVKDIRFSDNGNANVTESAYVRDFSTHAELSQNYDDIAVTHESGYNT
ncbi:MAG: DUF3822 family protein, partial [Proteobacteria bacterium]